jgi:GNAT superfamily N-acetyltransferase
METPAEAATVRRARPEDVPQLSGLLSVLFEQEADFHPEPARQARGLHLILAQPEIGHVYCMELGDSIVGMASILFTVSTAEGARVAWLEDMVVHPNHRGSGFGQRLLREAIRGARDAGCARITLLTDIDNESAQRLYLRSGFTRSHMTPLRLKL